MIGSRTTPCELGTIFHRAGTALLPRRRCSAGHLAPRYVGNGYCVACAKRYAIEYLARHSQKSQPQRRPKPQPRRQPSRYLVRFEDYQSALDYHTDQGGFLLMLGAGKYGVSSHERTVSKLRGNAWMDRCDVLECWDEVELARAPLAMAAE
jgi:hypothetical protein